MIYHKKIMKYFIIISIIMIGALPMLNFYPYLVKYDFKKLFNTDKVEMYTNYVFYKIFNKSLEQRRVIVGKNNFLFLGNASNSILDKTRGLYKYTNQDIENWTTKLKNVQTWFEDKNVQFVIAIAPNKHSVYSDNLPNWITYGNENITDSILRYAQKKDINMLDLRPILADNIKNYTNDLYFKTDTHWNGLGASIGYGETMKFINRTYDVLYENVKYSYTYHHSRGGDLANFLKISNILPYNHEEPIWFKFDKNNKLCHGKINKKTNVLEKCKLKNNPKFSINGQAQYVINKEAVNQKNVLLLCDSFGLHNSQLYNATFKNVWSFHYGHISPKQVSNFVKVHKPDIVIYQVAERMLYNPAIIKELR